ncbi:MAG: guanylate kinase [Muricomes sp.]
MGKICYIMGKSSSGKDSIFKMLKEKMPELKDIILYTTRPARAGETDGAEYHFVDEDRLKVMEEKGCVIELREYNTKHGVWKYFTADDGQIDLNKHDYIVIGTLESYTAMCSYFGKEKLIPVYIQVEDGLRLERALFRERAQDEPRYSEMCRRFLADEADFSEENLKKAGIEKRFVNNKIEDCIEEIYNYLQKK